VYLNAKQYIDDLDEFCGTGLDWEKFNGSNVLVVGGTGMIGTALVDLLERRNAKYSANAVITVMGRDTASARERFGALFDDDRFRFVEHDVTEPFPDLPPFDYIIHAGSPANPKLYSTDPVGTMKSNLVGTINVLEHARKTGTRSVLYVSSGEVYGDGGNEDFTETYSGFVDILNPRACYPSSKRAAETLCASYAKQYSLNVVVARPCHVYGPTCTRGDNRIASQFIRDAVAGKDIVMKSEGMQVRSYCYVWDCAVGIFAALLGGSSGNAYNVSDTGSVASIREYAETVASACGVRVRFDLPTGEERAAFNPATRAVLDASKLAALGWKPRVHLTEGIARTVRCLERQANE
jgi:UDP-glucuronate decarboxylase